MKLIKYTLIPLFFFALIAFSSCDRGANNPRGCVTSFIISIEEHDMSNAWGLLGRDAQTYYNQLGEKQRRSGKGAFENEINKIKSFRSAKYDYSIHTDALSPNGMKLVVNGGNEFKVAVSDEEGDYKIKDESSVRNILSVITKEFKSKEHTY